MKTKTIAALQVEDIDPSEEVWVLDTQQLEPGDILLSTTECIISTGIRILSLSNFSHAALHLGGGFLIEAVGSGVRRIHGRALQFPKPEYVTVLRHINLSPRKQRLIVESAAAHLYRPYSTFGALATKLRFVRPSEDSGRFCSQLVAEAYAEANKAIFDDPIDCRDVTPGDFAKSQNLKIIQGVVRRTRRQAVVHAMNEITPIWNYHRHDEGKVKRYEADYVHNVLLESMERAMSPHRCFDRPYHFFDGLRQLSASQNDEPEIVKKIDKIIADKLHEFNVTQNGVEPQATISGIIDLAPSEYLPLIFDGGPSEKCAFELEKLHSDLLFGRDWDEETWNLMTKEIQTERDRTKLTSLIITHFWMLGDLGKVQATYHWLAGEY